MTLFPSLVYLFLCLFCFPWILVSFSMELTSFHLSAYGCVQATVSARRLNPLRAEEIWYFILTFIFLCVFLYVCMHVCAGVPCVCTHACVDTRGQRQVLNFRSPCLCLRSTEIIDMCHQNCFIQCWTEPVTSCILGKYLTSYATNSAHLVLWDRVSNWPGTSPVVQAGWLVNPPCHHPSALA